MAQLALNRDVPFRRQDAAGTEAVSETDKPSHQVRERSMQSLEQFLASVEKRAFRRAELATHNADDALDIVQDAMLRLVRGYATRPAEEWEPLFHRILHSCIMDWHRRTRVRLRWRSWLGLGGTEQEDGVDPIQTLAAPDGQGPEDLAEQADDAARIERALRGLPVRQQQAFLLRAWDGLSVEETAQAMGCSNGSVKTHYSRARHYLRQCLEDGNED